MTNKLMATFLLAMGLLMGSVPLLAHHGAAAYDPSKTVILKGTVTDWVWANPHCWLKLDATSEVVASRPLSKAEVQEVAKAPSKGEMQHWIIEAGNPPEMIHQGFTKTTFKSGDEVTALVMPPKNSAPTGRIRYIVTTDGKVLGNGERFKSDLQE